MIPVRKSDVGGVCPGTSYSYGNNCCCRSGCCWGRCSNAPEDCIANASIPIEWVYHPGQNNYKVHRKGESMNDWSHQFSVIFLIMYMHVAAEYYDINGWPCFHTGGHPATATAINPPSNYIEFNGTPTGAPTNDQATPEECQALCAVRTTELRRSPCKTRKAGPMHGQAEQLRNSSNKFCQPKKTFYHLF